MKYTLTEFLELLEIDVTISKDYFGNNKWSPFTLTLSDSVEFKEHENTGTLHTILLIGKTEASLLRKLVKELNSFTVAVKNAGNAYREEFCYSKITLDK